MTNFYAVSQPPMSEIFGMGGPASNFHSTFQKRLPDVRGLNNRIGYLQMKTPFSPKTSSLFLHAHYGKKTIPSIDSEEAGKLNRLRSLRKTLRPPRLKIKKTEPHSSV
ncbi:hypothetical protein [Algoriphagus antarcticus]|uniref:hypothetical protein n=1 Tax=Algoriphagus antarcticus TaxID=238540 RepID=UPI00111FCB8B|nr:hypothetical protein [Algoriphagus antarcticus]